MLKIADEATFTRVVKISVPVDGGHREDTVKATFRVIDQEETAGFSLAKPDQLKAFLARIIVKLDDLADASGNPLPYSDELRDRITGKLYVSNALAKEYFVAIAGAREGN